MNRMKEGLGGNGIQQAWLAEKVGENRYMINGHIQNGQQPRLGILFEIADILEVKAKD